MSATSIPLMPEVYEDSPNPSVDGVSLPRRDWVHMHYDALLSSAGLRNKVNAHTCFYSCLKAVCKDRYITLFLVSLALSLFLSLSLYLYLSLSLSLPLPLAPLAISLSSSLLLSLSLFL